MDSKISAPPVPSSTGAPAGNPPSKRRRGGKSKRPVIGAVVDGHTVAAPPPSSLSKSNGPSNAGKSFAQPAPRATKNPTENKAVISEQRLAPNDAAAPLPPRLPKSEKGKEAAQALQSRFAKASSQPPSGSLPKAVSEVPPVASSKSFSQQPSTSQSKLSSASQSAENLTGGKPKRQRNRRNKKHQQTDEGIQYKSQNPVSHVSSGSTEEVAPAHVIPGSSTAPRNAKERRKDQREGKRAAYAAVHGDQDITVSSSQGPKGSAIAAVEMPLSQGDLDRNARRKDKKRRKQGERKKERETAILNGEVPPPKKPGSTATGKKNRRAKGRRDPFVAWLSKEEVDQGVAEERYQIGTIKISKRRRNQAFVVIQGVARDVLVLGPRDRNRALNGDTVAVEIFGEVNPEDVNNYRNGAEIRQDAAAKAKVIEAIVDAEDDEDLEKEEIPHKVGRVVCVVERRPGQQYSGFLMPVRWQPGQTKELQALLLGEDEPQEPLPNVATLTIQDDDGDEDWIDEEVVDDEEVLAEEAAAVPTAVPAVNQAKIPHNIYFKPCDNSAPLLMVPLRDCPKDLADNYPKYRNQIFVAKVHRWAETSTYPFGILVKNIGMMGEIAVETEAILESNSVCRGEFTDKITSSLPRLPWSIPADEIARRRDLRKDRIFTIDPETAKDLDDAVSMKKLDDGNLLVGVHIADVSFFVKPDTALDEEARFRATTTYMVQRAYPMLPGILCEDLCSLNPGVDRLAFSVFWTMTPDARILDTWFGRSVIASCIKMSYGNAQALIDDLSWEEAVGKPISGDHTEESVTKDVKEFHRISRLLRARRFENGALTINQPKLSFRLDETGHPISCSPYEIKASNQLIEEFMLLANISVAKKISDAFPSEGLLRCHPSPNKRSLDEFLDYLSRMGYSDMDASSAGALQRSMSKVEDPEVRQIFQLLAVKPMQRAKYFCCGDLTEDQWRHYALAFECYTHFTSPIRRYADVIVHRLLQAALDESDAQMERPEVSDIAKQCNTKKEDARSAQDASLKLYLCIYLRRLEIANQLPIIEEAIIMDIGEKAFDVYIPRYALDRRVFCQDSGLLRAEVTARRTEITLFWPEEEYQLPPSSPAGNRGNDAIRETKDQRGFTTVWREAPVGHTATFKILQHVYVRLNVEGRSPLDIKTYMIHPEHVPKVRYDHVAGNDLGTSASLIEEVFEESDQ